MAKKKAMVNRSINLPIRFTAAAAIPNASSKAMAAALKKDNVALCVTLMSIAEEGVMTFHEFYKDDVEGNLSFTKEGDSVRIEADFIAKLQEKDLGIDDYPNFFPAKIVINGVLDDAADTHGFAGGDDLILPNQVNPEA